MGANEEDKSRALVRAASHGHIEIVKLLISLGTPLDSLSLYSENPLVSAVEYNHMQCVQALVEAGADIDALYSGLISYDEENKGLTSISMAMLKGHMDIVSYLWKHKHGGQEVQFNGDELDFCMRYLVADQNIPFLSYLSVFQYACIYGNVGLMKKMRASWDFCIDSGIKQETPLSCALASNSVEVVEALLGMGADPNNGFDLNFFYTNDTPLCHAIENNDEKIVELLVRFGADVNKHGVEGMTPLQFALKMNKLKAAKVLLDAGASLEIETAEVNHGDCLEHNFAGHYIGNFCRSVEAFEWLQQLGVDLTKHNKKSPLSSFVDAGNIELVKKVLDIGADVNSTDEYGETPIFSAIYDPEIFYLLMEHGARLDVIAQDGKTVLHKAVEASLDEYSANKVAEVIDIILKQGGERGRENKRVKDTYGETPLDLAIKFSLSSVAKQLR